MTSINNPITPNILQDNARKLEYKNLIKEKILKPSKLPKYTDIRTHHSHLVIRDSHYLIKSPTSFITCASCHRGRVLKIASIQEASTEAILKEVYTTISKNPCSKRKQTPKEPKDTFVKSSSLNLLPTNQLVNPLQEKYKSALSLVSEDPSFRKHFSSPTAASSLNISRYSINGGLSSAPTILPHPSTSSSISTAPTSTSSSSLVSGTRIPTIEDFLDDFEDTLELPQLDEKLDIKATGSTMKVTTYTLSSLFNGHSAFPAHFDFFLSLGIDNDICKNFYQNDTLIIPFPTYSSTLFVKDFNKDHFLKDDILSHTIHTRIQNFVAQPDLNLHSFKIIIIFNYFQEGIPERPHEHQAHKYVGNVHVIHAFNVLDDSSLSYTNSRYSFNHNYTWVEPKEEGIKTEIFNELIIKRVQNEIFLKYQQDLLGSHINYSVIERGSILNMINYTVDDSFQVTSAASLFVVSYITLKILRVLTGEDGLQMITYLLSVKVNTKHNIHILKLLLDTLREQQRHQLPQSGL